MLMRSIAVAAVIAALVSTAPDVSRRSAPTFYVAVQAERCESNSVQANGVSNLPEGAFITVVVTEFEGDGWRNISDENRVQVGSDGFFHITVQPRSGQRIPTSSLLRAYFAPYSPKQSSEVLRITGDKGQRLGGLSNPQVFQVSGPNYGIETLARITGCPSA